MPTPREPGTSNQSSNRRNHDHEALVLAALNHHHRRHLLLLLTAHPRTVGELARHFPISRAAVSQHLAALVQAGLASVTQQGTRRRYQARPDGLGPLVRYLNALETEASQQA